jgi:protein tyrosine/serine phosphatase
LSATGVQALLAYGIRTIIDLRNADEQATDPHPFVTPKPTTHDLTCRNIQLGQNASTTARDHIRSAPSRPDLYCRVLDHYQDGIAAVMSAIADAPPAGVLVHFHAGKDRTGMIAALLLALADVPDEVIAEDYALSAVMLRRVHQERLRQEPDPARRAVLAEALVPVRETMLTLLAHLTHHHGGAARYLAAIGVTSQQIVGLRERMRR